MNKLNVEILKLDKPNQNGRTYPSEEITKNLETLNHKAENNQLYGELGYPENADDFTFAQVNLERASHALSNLRIEGEHLIADFKILKTSKGAMLEQLYGSPNTGFGIRACGDVDDNGVVSNLEIITFDFINNPA